MMADCKFSNSYCATLWCDRVNIWQSTAATYWTSGLYLGMPFILVLYQNFPMHHNMNFKKNVLPILWYLKEDNIFETTSCYNTYYPVFIVKNLSKCVLSVWSPRYCFRTRNRWKKIWEARIDSNRARGWNSVWNKRTLITSMDTG